jgi:hypothetical protein
MKTLRILTILLLLFNGIGAIFGGWSLIRDPSGADLGLPLCYLQYSPFKDYFIPGIILFTVNGLFCLAAMIWTIFQWKYYIWLILFQGALLTGWIIIQVIMLREISYLHYIYGGIGIALLWIGWILKRKTG